jgi:hypothetical protein
MESSEKLLFSNSFGSVSDKRVILHYKNGTEDLPVGSITSISIENKRNYFFAIPGLIISFFFLIVMVINIINISNQTPGMAGAGAGEILFALIVLLILLPISIIKLIGHYIIQISVGGNNRRPLKIANSKKTEASEFIDAVKKAVIK